jgi:hypothetical protein
MNCLNETCLLSDKNERIFVSSKSISLNESRIDFRKNWFEMIDDDNLNERKL